MAENADTDEIEITPEMVEAGVLEAREHMLGETLEGLVRKIFLAMALEQAPSVIDERFQ